uniref:DDE superfamily endonuclease n=1 Tax=Nothobranchius rachovii TaxID=451742 RepID=A0A1A8NVX0_9TELE
MQFNQPQLTLTVDVIGPYNTGRLVALLHDLYGRVVLGEERDVDRRNQPTYIIVWDNVAFHHSHAVTEWFVAHPRMESLNPIEEFFASWRWKVYDHHPHDQMSLLDAMYAGCLDIPAVDCQGWIRHARRFFPRCIALDDIRCDVDENLWPNGEDRVDEHIESVSVDVVFTKSCVLEVLSAKTNTIKNK